MNITCFAVVHITQNCLSFRMKLAGEGGRGKENHGIFLLIIMKKLYLHRVFFKGVFCMYIYATLVENDTPSFVYSIGFVFLYLCLV